MGLDTQETVRLPDPQLNGPSSVEGVLQARRSVREFAPGTLSLREVTQLLWAAQGITGTDPSGLRTAPSAGALYPLEVILLAGEVDDLAPGLYRYRPRAHSLVALAEGDRRDSLAQAALAQGWIAEAACVLCLAAVYERTTGKYGARGERYVHMEVGHVAQNVYLQARTLGLGTTMVGAFNDRDVQQLLGLDEEERPLGLLPVGRLR